MNVNNGIVASLSRRQPGFNLFKEKIPDNVALSRQAVGVEELALSGDHLPSGSDLVSPLSAVKSGFRELISNTFAFDIGALLRLRTFLYLIAGTGMFLFQTHNNLAITNLAQENEKLREQIQMNASVITAQELKVRELHSIHNIAQDAASLGLIASRIPAVELEP